MRRTSGAYIGALNVAVTLADASAAALAGVAVAPGGLLALRNHVAAGTTRARVNRAQHAERRRSRTGFKINT